MDAQTAKVRPITIAVVALGGEGGGVLADWIVDLANHGGYLAQATSVPGVAQRTGATVYYLELFPKSAAQAAGRDPVLALMPVPGRRRRGAGVRADGRRARGRARLRHAGQDIADRVDPSRLRHDREDRARRRPRGCRRRCWRPAATPRARLVAFDMEALADATGSALSAVLFGALAGSGALPVPAHRLRGGDPARPGRRQQQPRRVRRRVRGGAFGRMPALSARDERWPPQRRSRAAEARAPSIAAGIERLHDYQDARLCPRLPGAARALPGDRAATRRRLRPAAGGNRAPARAGDGL